MANPSPSGHLCRLQPDQGAIIFFSEDVQKAVRTLSHIPDALLEIREQHLATHFLAAFVQHNSLEMPGAGDLTHPKRADENIVFPVGELRARVERDAGDRDGWDPDDDRFLHALHLGLVGDARSLIRAAISHRRPAVVSSAADDIQFVAAVRAILVLPDFAGFGMHKQSKLVAMSERVNLRLVAGLSGKRIIGRHGAVVAEANNLSAVDAGS